MSASVSSFFTGMPVILLGFAFFMAVSLIFSLRSGRVRPGGHDLAAPVENRLIFWTVCAVKLGLVLLSLFLFFVARGRA